MDLTKLHNYQEKTLADVATWERARGGKVYPAGCSTLQISATRGQVGYLEQAGEVQAKYAVITANAGINPKYLNLAMQRNIDEFCRKYQTGLNIIINDIAHIRIQLHDPETQAAIARIMEWLDEEIAITEKEIEAEQKKKKVMLDKMFV